MFVKAKRATEQLNNLFLCLSFKKLDFETTMLGKISNINPMLTMVGSQLFINNDERMDAR
jgi:hypothetical protein